MHSPNELNRAPTLACQSFVTLETTSLTSIQAIALRFVNKRNTERAMEREWNTGSEQNGAKPAERTRKKGKGTGRRNRRDEFLFLCRLLGPLIN